MARGNEYNGEESIVVAIHKEKGSQYAVKWAVDRFLSRGQAITLLHVRQKVSSVPTPTGGAVSISDVNNEVARTLKQQLDSQTRELFLPFHCFCSRKDIRCIDVILEDMDIAKALIDYVSTYAIENLVLGAPSRNSLVKRFKTTDVPSSVSKGMPSFCNVYVIAKGKIASVRPATTPPPSTDPLHCQWRSNPPSRSLQEVMEFRSPFTRASALKYEPSMTDSDISFVSSGRPSTIDRIFPSFYDQNKEYGMSPWLSTSSDYDNRSFASSSSGTKSIDACSSPYDLMSWSSQSQSMEDVEEEMRRLRLELKQTMEMYSAACKEALAAKQKAGELHRLKLEEEQKLEKARLAEEAALALAEKEKEKCKAAIEAAETSQKIAELEAQKRKHLEMINVLTEPEEKKKKNALDDHLRYRKYTIEEIEEATECFSSSLKIGEGGYGPVYKCYLDHTPVAVKVLRKDAAQGRSQFQQEVEVLCNIRHPNMVLLLGACPEHGCLVYEYMANGSLDDCLFRRHGTPVLPWQLRFRIATEIATGLLFLQQNKPEPIVHRDLKPGNILLDRNYVSKISDVGLARLVPPSVADSVTQYRMTSAAGTFCYIDPEYQQSGMLGIKSDIYSLGIMLLQIITAKPPMGLTHIVQRSIENGTFAEVLDPAVPDWPVEEALAFAKLALQCVELRRKDRPDLGKVVLPELRRLNEIAEETMPIMNNLSGAGSSTSQSQTSTVQDMKSDPQSLQSGSASSRNCSS